MVLRRSLAQGREIMRIRLGDSLAFAAAGITLALCWLLFFLLFNNPINQILFVIGNVIIAAGILLIILPMAALRGKGKPQEGESFTATTSIVKSGIYSVVRHPLYLGWLLMYPAAMLVSQQWVIVILGVIGIISMDQITRAADYRLIEKFGPSYEAYIQEVPRLNIISGVLRKLSSKG
jgi:protein-S-isoprenylcysteine O-methyltransferase Ste14